MNDNVNENWNRFIKGLTEAPMHDREDYIDAQDEERKLGLSNRDDATELGRIMITISAADERTIQNAIRKGLDDSGILTHILDELNKD